MLQIKHSQNIPVHVTTLSHNKHSSNPQLVQLYASTSFIVLSMSLCRGEGASTATASQPAAVHLHCFDPFSNELSKSTILRTNTTYN